jgi:hypothetical protein
MEYEIAMRRFQFQQRTRNELYGYQERCAISIEANLLKRAILP